MSKIISLPLDACTGCSACFAICPQAAITIKENHEGFLYPEIDRRLCISCGLCVSVCHAINRPQKTSPIQSFECYHKQRSIRLGSSSGGIYTAISEIVLGKGGIVFGAIFGHGCKNVFHSNSDDAPFAEQRKSKYVESHMQNSYNKVKKELSYGRWVLFSGTPCQVSGLRMFLGELPAKLITVDFVCHGVPSRKVYREYLKHLEEIHGDELTRIDFRPKLTGWQRHSILAEFKNGKTYRNDAALDKYFTGFMAENLFLRRSCYSCAFRQRHQADFTVADHWKVEKEKWSPDFGYSLVMLNTEIALKTWDKLKANVCAAVLEPNEYEYALSPRNRKHYSSDKREFFFDIAKQSGYIKAMEQMVGTASWKRRIVFHFQMIKFKLVKSLCLIGRNGHG